MPPSKGSRGSSKSSSKLALNPLVSEVLYPWTQNSISDLLFNPSKSYIISSYLFFAELVLCFGVIFRIRYTEIDWVAYMQEVEGFLNGTRNYTELKGDTGPLVYPAGFVYFFSFLYSITSKGQNIKLAQYLFVLFYLLVIALVFFIYTRTKRIPPFGFAFMCVLSYRVHSIFILRLFNDPIAMMFFYGAVCLFLVDRWTLGCLLYSIAVSIKMNVLLTAPGLLLLLLHRFGLQRTVPRLALCGIVQLALGAPFLLADPMAYVVRSFDLGRQFLFQWTVNWRFLPEWLFLDRTFHVALLSLHLVVLIVFFACYYNRLFPSNHKGNIAPHSILLALFASNFIGMCFSRSLHYQFYVWYYHMLPYLLWSTRLPTAVRLLLLGVIELCWNVYPSTNASSATLHAAHLLLLVSLFAIPSHEAEPSSSKSKKKAT